MFYTLTPYFNFYEAEMEWIMTFHNVMICYIIQSHSRFRESNIDQYLFLY